ncbi:M16 family metallopeptidase [Sphingomonas glacialis]|uniref:M16 family metallopeptidase n=1 Tax=Sphingomonas glacialis TaxID=658225 RepID=UPI0013875B51|nr:insulinase family protein [Sphingomonas glacialis]
MADPDVRFGTLPSGMRYAIKRASIPNHGLSLRLGIDVGSFEEQDKERGFAHLVEHAAFRTTRSAPDGGLDRRFAALGVAFGRDQNAATTLYKTTYRLDFATTDAVGMAQGLGWLRDVGDGIVFTQAGVASERGVVQAELQSRGGAGTAASRAVSHFQMPDARTVARSPEGTLDTIAGATADTLRAFYDRWYRPENAVLIVVGDQPVDAIEAQVRTTFGTWTGKGTAPLHAKPGTIDFARELDSVEVAAPSLPTTVSACRLRPPRPRNEDESIRSAREVHTTLWRNIFHDRITRVIDAGHSGLLGAVIVGQESDEFVSTCLIAMPTGDEWEKGMAVAQAELLRLIHDGPTEQEIEAEVVERRAVLRSAVSGAAARTTDDLADTMLARLLDRRPVLAPREAMYAFDAAVEDLDPAGMKRVVDADWSGSGPLLAVVAPKSGDSTRPRGLWSQNAHAATLAAYADRGAVVWPYTSFGIPGRVVERAEISDPGFVRLRFANGLVLNFKQTPLEANDIELRARFGAGRRELPANGYIGAMLGTQLFALGGLGRLSAEEMTRALHEVTWPFRYDLGLDFFQFSQSTNPVSLKSELQVFAAFLTDPGFRTTIDERLPSAIDIMYRTIGSQPMMAANEAFLATVDPDAPERIPPPAAMLTLRTAEFARLLRPALTEAPIELTIVGDIAEAEAVRLVAATFGALPPRGAAERPSIEKHFLRIPERAFPVIRTTYTGTPDRGAASLIWPLFVAEPPRRREEYALKLVAGVFNDALRQRARVELGKTYSPMVVTVMPDHADQGLLIAQVEAQPGDLDGLAAVVTSVADTIAHGAITAEAIDAARKPLLAQAAAARGKNAWWAAAMSGSARSTAVTEELVNFTPLLSAVTLDEVKAAAAKWLARPPIVVLATPKGPDSNPPPSAAHPTASHGAAR